MHIGRWPLKKKVNDGIINRQSLPELDLWKRRRRLGRTLSRQWNQSSTPSCSCCYTTLNSTKKITKSTIWILATNLSYLVVLVCFIYITYEMDFYITQFSIARHHVFRMTINKRPFLDQLHSKQILTIVHLNLPFPVRYSHAFTLHYFSLLEDCAT